MPFDASALLAMPPRETVARHTERDVMLYALGVGVGAEYPTSAEALGLAYERDLMVLPTMATVLAAPGFWQMEPQYEIDWRRLLHAEQSVEIFRPLPVEGELISRLVVEDIIDKGEQKGALMYSRRDIFDAATGDHLAVERRGAMLRGDGGKGGRVGGGRPTFETPDGSADQCVTLTTFAQQALLYRLSGDYNPLHVDPAVAQDAGFDRPILHGLCTFGIVGRALIEGLCSGNPSRLRRIDGRFSSPVFPGETLETRIWHLGEGKSAYITRAIERDTIVIKNGYVEYLPAHLGTSA